MPQREGVVTENEGLEADSDAETEARSIHWIDRIPLGLAFRLM